MFVGSPETIAHGQKYNNNIIKTLQIVTNLTEHIKGASSMLEDYYILWVEHKGLVPQTDDGLKYILIKRHNQLSNLK